jgi:hypothetical protein
MTIDPAQDGTDPAATARVRPYLAGPVPAEDSAAPDIDIDATDPNSAQASQVGLRPFVLTSGRVLGLDPDIELETQVTACTGESAEQAGQLAPEQQAIVSLCREPVSVAEISALLHLQLGVTRVLVGDLRATGYLDIHQRNTALPHDPDTILRVMRGLRSIS